MRRIPTARIVLVATVAALVSFGCKSNPKNGAGEGSSGIDSTSFDDGTGGGLGGEDRMATSELQSVYFDYDMALVRDDQKPTLQANATAIGNRSEWRRVTIEGHCDERGSEEYNLALGERRAKVVARYLSDLGVPSDRLTTRSYGELEPASLGHDELAWRLNRRAQIEMGG
jgi:peptidoglycan-associated lipoprotein